MKRLGGAAWPEFTTAGVAVLLGRAGGAVDGFALDAGRVRGIRLGRE